MVVLSILCMTMRRNGQSRLKKDLCLEQVCEYECVCIVHLACLTSLLKVSRSENVAVTLAVFVRGHIGQINCM